MTIGVNSNRRHPFARRKHTFNGEICDRLHAEMEALLQAEPGDRLEVLRWHRDGVTLSMAHPCPHCLERIRKKGIVNVRYTDWNGHWQEFDPLALSEEDVDWWSDNYYITRPRPPGFK